MANHRSNTPTLASLSARQWGKFAAIVAAVALVAGAGIASSKFYARGESAPSAVTSFSATEPAATRGAVRDALDARNGNSTYVTVRINGKNTTVLGTDFTDVKSVLDEGDIVLDPDDTVSPSLDSKVSESTVITIERAGATVETSDSKIAFNEVRKETAALPKGTEKVEQEGVEGVMETTNLVTRAGDEIKSSNTIASWVKTAPVDKIVLVGTGSTSAGGSSSSGGSLGTTVPAGQIQQWAHDYLLSNGYSEADFTAASYIISHESGWNPQARNPSSGAFGLAQALPGSKMASAGADWATNYQTQFKWFLNYCNSRYGSISGAYAFWVSHRWY